MPTINIYEDSVVFYYYPDQNENFWPAAGEIEVTDEEKVWIERTMKRFWAVQDFFREKVKRLDS